MTPRCRLEKATAAFYFAFSQNGNQTFSFCSSTRRLSSANHLLEAFALLLFTTCCCSCGRLFLFSIFAHKSLCTSAGNRNRAMCYKSKNNLNMIIGKYLRLISRNPRINTPNETLVASLELQEMSNFKLRGDIEAVDWGCAQKWAPKTQH